MSAKRKRLDAVDHEQAYDLWAKHFNDPNLLTNRDAEATHFKMARIVDRLPLNPAARVLDVGPGDGTLFRLIAPQVSSCIGIDPSSAALEKLQMLHADVPNVEFVMGRSTKIPYEDQSFDVVVINSVLHMLNSHNDMVASMEELTRVTRSEGVIFVGELPFRPELEKGILTHLARKCYEYGVWGLLRLLFTVYVKPVMRGEPIVTYPTGNLFFSECAFNSLCVRLGLEVQMWRHQEVRRPSLTRNDYLLSRKMSA